MPERLTLIRVRFTLLYSFFVAVGITTNLITQLLVAKVLTQVFQIYIGMSLGALTSMLVKFQLDRHYIFLCRPSSLITRGRQFFFYSLFGIVNISCFWSAELTFHFLFQAPSMRYVGAFIGLIVGHALKYRVDKRLVFKDALPAMSKGPGSVSPKASRPDPD
jgi:hypothetical protein